MDDPAMGVKQLVRIWWWACTVMVLAVSAWMWWALASDGWATAVKHGRRGGRPDCREPNQR